MAHDHERYLVSLILPRVPDGEGDSTWPVCTLREARSKAREVRATAPKTLGTEVSISIPDEDTIESWVRVRKSKAHTTGWRHRNQ